MPLTSLRLSHPLVPLPFRRLVRRAAAWRLLADESGVAVPIAVLLLVVLLGFCAFVLDVGVVLATRRGLQNAADAAALAGAREVQRYILDGSPADPSANAAERALLVADLNGVGVEGATCPSDGDATVTLNDAGEAPHSWEVHTSQRVTLLFGRAVGVPSMCVSARALAVVVEIRATKVWPWGVLNGVLDDAGFGSPVLLKEGAGGADRGNFGIVDFDCGGGGTPDYDRWARNGFGTRGGEVVPVRLPGAGAAWAICTETGNRASENRRLAGYIDDHSDDACLDDVPDVRCSLYGLVPILRETVWPSGTKTVHVVDFAVFRLREITVRGGHTEIGGEFVELAGGVGPTYTPDPDGRLRGLIGVRLWR